MDVAVILALVKSSIGMTTAYRDDYLTRLIEGVMSELTLEKGIVLDGTDPNHLMFVVDYAAWRFMSKDDNAGMPEHLRWRLKNLYVHAGGPNVQA